MHSTPEYPEFYYEILEGYLGPEAAAWARLPPEDRERELRWFHENFNTPDDLAWWPPELSGGLEADAPLGPTPANDKAQQQES
jgi:hypothetical protein